MKKSRKTLLVNLMVPALLLGGYFWFSSMDQAKNPKSFTFDLPKISKELDKRISSEDLKGKPTIVNFWSSWCKACSKDAPYLMQLAHRKDVQVIGIAVYDKLEDLLESGKLEEKHWPNVFDESSKVAERYGVNALPQTFLLDHNGIVRYHVDNHLNDKQFKTITNKIAILSKEAEKNKDFPIQLSAISPPQKLPPFKLINSQGKDFGEKNLENKIWIANFVFTSCKSICPVLTRKMKKLQDEFKDSKLEFVSFSVDPKNDTPARLRAYGKKYRADQSRWHFLTGNWDIIKDLIVTGFKIGAPDDPIFHTDRFVLVDNKLRIRGYYSSNSKRAMKRLRKDVSYLLKN